ncbi:MAG TPA: YdcF family protein [Sphingomonadaceae bacterium]|nr:YdcF family protein [Sphingomonadaceae bacterium]
MMIRLLSAALLAWLLGFLWFAVSLPAPAPPAWTDAIVVVTGGPGRVQRGLALLEAKHARRMLVSGADRRVKPMELADAYHAPRALIACCVDLGYEAADTRSNAEETIRWLTARRFRSVRLVTSDWHMHRARFELARLLPASIALTADAVRGAPDFTALFKEYNKYLLRRVMAPLGY